MPTKQAPSMTSTSDTVEDRRRPPLSCGLPVGCGAARRCPVDCSGSAVEERTGRGDLGSPTVFVTGGVTVCRARCFIVEASSSERCLAAIVILPLEYTRGRGRGGCPCGKP